MKLAPPSTEPEAVGYLGFLAEVCDSFLARKDDAEAFRIAVDAIERAYARRSAASGERPTGATATREQVARWLGVSVSTLKRWSDNPQSNFPRLRNGKRRYSVADITAWLEPPKTTADASDLVARFVADQGGNDWLSRVPT